MSVAGCCVVLVCGSAVLGFGGGGRGGFFMYSSLTLMDQLTSQITTAFSTWSAVLSQVYFYPCCILMFCI